MKLSRLYETGRVPAQHARTAKHPPGRRCARDRERKGPNDDHADTTRPDAGTTTAACPTTATSPAGTANAVVPAKPTPTAQAFSDLDAAIADAQAREQAVDTGRIPTNPLDQLTHTLVMAARANTAALVAAQTLLIQLAAKANLK